MGAERLAMNTLPSHLYDRVSPSAERYHDINDINKQMSAFCDMTFGSDILHMFFSASSPFSLIAAGCFPFDVYISKHFFSDSRSIGYS
jgi:hypothetical protein